jgi:pimeloyl-ACP methyl ester carboxylesterase
MTTQYYFQQERTMGFILYRFLVLALLLMSRSSSQDRLPNAPAVWDVLAPFPAGSRELGGDPLESFGGIHTIPRNDGTMYPSELVFGGQVGWTQTKPNQNGWVSVQWNSTYVNWNLIEGWAGTAGSLFQGWALGDFVVDHTGSYVHYCLGVDRYYVDTFLFKGDAYGLRQQYNVVHLKSEKHTFYVYLSGMEATSFQCGFLSSSDSLPLRVVGVLAPDIIVYNGVSQLASSFFSLAVVNLDESKRLDKISLTVTDPNLLLVSQDYPSLESGQSSVINFRLKSVNSLRCHSQHISSDGQQIPRQRRTPTPSRFTHLRPSRLSTAGQLFSSIDSVEDFVTSESASSYYSFNVTLKASNSLNEVSYPFVLNCYNWTQPYKYTFLDIDHSTQYAVVIPPRHPCNVQPNSTVTRCSILLSLHGAGVDANSDAWKASYIPQNYSWVLLPTNRGIFGFDWQGPGRVNVWKGVEWFVSALPGVPPSLKKSYNADAWRIIYTGHSMGGHGCWVVATHYPDRALAVAPAAGWIKMQFYIPFFTRVGLSLSHPFLNGLMEASVAEYDTDMYSPNLLGIPLLVRMGALDDNVPPFHLKRMARVVDQLSGHPNYVQISEVAGQGHWWWGVTDDATMQSFFNQHNVDRLPTLPLSFTIVTHHPNSFEGRAGIKILQFEIPYRVATIRINRNLSSGSWSLKTMNVRRFGFYSVPTLDFPLSLTIDGQPFERPPRLPEFHFCKLDQSWTICKGDTWQLTERNPSNYGPVAQVMEGRITIVYGTQNSSGFDVENCRRRAVYIANQLFYQGWFIVTIIPDTEFNTEHERTNIILLGSPAVNSVTNTIKNTTLFPVKYANDGRAFKIGNVLFDGPNTGTVFVSPNVFISEQTSYDSRSAVSSSRLIVVFSGVDERGFNIVTQLFPVKSDITIPDYMVVGADFSAQGQSGVLAAGFWNNFWQFDPRIGYLRPY